MQAELYFGAFIRLAWEGGQGRFLGTEILSGGGCED